MRFTARGWWYMIHNVRRSDLQASVKTPWTCNVIYLNRGTIFLHPSPRAKNRIVRHNTVIEVFRGWIDPLPNDPGSRINGHERGCGGGPHHRR